MRKRKEKDIYKINDVQGTNKKKKKIRNRKDVWNWELIGQGLCL